MLRIKIELVPHGVESMSEVIHDIWIENNGTGVPGGPAEGGVGNYNIFPDGETLEHLHCVDYPDMYACGVLEGVPRTADHRFIVAAEALSIVCEWNKRGVDAKAKGEPFPSKIKRQFKTTACPDNLNIP